MLLKDAPTAGTGKHQPDSGFSSANSGESSTRGCENAEDRQEEDTSCSCDFEERDCDGLTRDDLPKLPYEFFYRQDNEGDTWLHAALTLGGLFEATCWLIDVAPHPCLLDIRNDDSLTALHLAVMAREARVVRRLVLFGANKQLRTNAGNTALHLACLRGDLLCAKALTDQPSADEERRVRCWLDSHGRTARSTRALVDTGELELRNYNGETCLHVAASHGHPELVRRLLHLGANVDAREGLRGMTALHLAIEKSHFDVVRLLVSERPFCIDAVTYAGLTTHELAGSLLDRRLVDKLAEKELAAFAGMRVQCLAT